MSTVGPGPGDRRASAFQRWLLRVLVDLYRRTGGRIGGRIGPTPVLLLTTVGRKSGRRHTAPIGYFDRDGTRFVVASNGGLPYNPAWYFNLVAHPDVEVEVRRERYRAVATPVVGEERQQLWDYVMAAAPAYRRYQRAPREIPLVTLRRVT
jgi:deazaflavin-dependent oxidoreductase (nitroreductase family)